MVSSDFRAEAREKLKGKWGKAVGITAAYLLIFFVIGFVEGLLGLEEFASIINVIIEIPLAFGMTIAFLKLFEGEEVKAFDFFKIGFGNFGKSWGITFRIILKMIVPMILIIVSAIVMGVGMAGMATAGILAMSSSSSSVGGMGILMLIGFVLYIVSLIWAMMKGYYYQLAIFVASENPEMTAKEAVQKSEELMKNKRGKLFCLQFSFIGWAILTVFTLGFGILGLMPYILCATASFYKNALNEKEEVIEVKE